MCPVHFSKTNLESALHCIKGDSPLPLAKIEHGSKRLPSSTLSAFTLIF